MVERIRNLIESRKLTPTQFADSIGVARPIISHILSGRNKPSLDVVQRILAAMPELSIPWLLNGTGQMELDSTTRALPRVSSGPEPIVSAAIIAAQPYETAPLTLVPTPTPNPAETAAAAAPISRVRYSKSTTIPAYNRFATNHNDAADALTTPQSAPTLREIASMPVAETSSIPKLPPPATVFTAKTEVNMPSQSSGDMALPANKAFSSANVTEQKASLSDGYSGAKSATAPELGNQHPASHLLAGSGKAIRRIVVFYQDGSFADYQPE